MMPSLLLRKLFIALGGDNAEIISAKTARIKELEEEKKAIEENFKKLEHRRNELITRANELSAENIRLEAEKKIADDRWWEAEKELTSMKLANKKLEGKTIEHLEKRCREAEKALEDEKQVSKDLNVIINSKNNKLESELMDYINENSKLRAKIARIGGMCDGVKKIVKE